ncbi:MAG: hypothetical protein AAF443_00600 [Chlamydiota bacterium]
MSVGTHINSIDYQPQIEGLDDTVSDNHNFLENQLYDLDDNLISILNLSRKSQVPNPKQEVLRILDRGDKLTKALNRKAPYLESTIKMLGPDMSERLFTIIDDQKATNQALSIFLDLLLWEHNLADNGGIEEDRAIFLILINKMGAKLPENDKERLIERLYAAKSFIDLVYKLKDESFKTTNDDFQGSILQGIVTSDLYQLKNYHKAEAFLRDIWNLPHSLETAKQLVNFLIEELATPK